MSNLQSFNLVSHYTGEASTAGSTIPSTSVTFTGSSTLASASSFVKWRPATQTTTPNKRFLRSFKNQSFAYLITLRPKTIGWQTRLSELEIGYTRFVRPDHVHCRPDPSQLAPGSTNINDPGFGVGIRVHTFPGGGTIANPTYEVLNASGSVIRRVVGTSDGKLFPQFTTDFLATAASYRVTDPTGAFGVIFFSGSGSFQYNAVPTTLQYLLDHTISNPIKDNIWPQDTFTAFGAAYVLADHDWMPRVIPTHFSAGSPVDFDASMTLWRIGNSRLNVGSYATTSQADATPTANSTVIPGFAFSRHEALPPGLYWRPSTYPSAYPGGSRWSAVPGSDVTGYTPPTEEPSCPFVVKQGTI